MQLEILKYLYDIRHACQLLKQFTDAKDLSDYLANTMLRSAVERQFEIIGEALNQALRRDPSLANHISNSGRIIAFRNRLIHGYASISDEVVWGLLESQLPILTQEVSQLLEKSN
ncbi:Uncharacterized conserved protein, contains HEPN domain [Geoalkalibacter ferrihydriticus]|uniref:Antitoxin n=2 Tax=Geoalkalibacter ferrihydriticus TaxID=392333 RepID=A0A0C2DWB1_9BACT|nr:HepT-like ribonuclease domain-containing protein [Geoalkalibacter ferrihydriticus]KIH77724.1 hypothetical protein GFER_03460 [Geoalkalibacter ferrihydriticus DSM 17813]SDL75894.1 Uncharacterized conserved protein, contains HEPN domain [Geoalkalibacter ferrihydriticus]